MNRTAWTALLWTCLVAVMPGHARAGAVSGLGVINSYPSGVSRFGSVITGSQPTPSGASEAFRWTPTSGLVGLGHLGGVDSNGRPSSEAFGISGNGSVVVGWSFSPTKIEAFRWTAASGMVPLGVPGDGVESSRATGVSSDGSVIVGYSVTAVAYEAFRWTAQSGMVGIGGLGGPQTFRSHAAGVSADGSVIVGHAGSPSGIGTEAFRWTAATGIVALGPAPEGSTTSYAEGISADGSTIFGFYLTPTGIRKGFRWTQASGMVAFGALADGRIFTEPIAASGDGSKIVGRSMILSHSEEAAIWTQAGGFQSVDAHLASLGIDRMGWGLTLASGISADGQTIAGYGVNPDGLPEGFVVGLPEPSTGLPLGVGLLAMTGGRRRSTKPTRG